MVYINKTYHININKIYHIKILTVEIYIGHVYFIFRIIIYNIIKSNFRNLCTMALTIPSKKRKKQTKKKTFQSPENISGQIIKAYEILPTKLF